jgi:CheY-like chemotaxis protein
MEDTTRSVLVVERDAELRERIGSWLESAGLEVYACPGPSAPLYTCIASEGRPCPLAKVADLVLLDLWLASESALMGTSASELLSYYLSSGKPVVVVDHGHDELRPFRDEVSAVLEFPPERRDVIESIRVLLHAAGRAGDEGPAGIGP